MRYQLVANQRDLSISTIISDIIYSKTGEYPQYNYSYSDSMESPEDYTNNFTFTNMEKPSWDDLRTWYDEMQSKITITDGELLFSHGAGSGNPADGFLNIASSSGLPLLLAVLKPPPGLPKQIPGPLEPTPKYPLNSYLNYFLVRT